MCKNNDKKGNAVLMGCWLVLLLRWVLFVKLFFTSRVLSFIRSCQPGLSLMSKWVNSNSGQNSGTRSVRLSALLYMYIIVNTVIAWMCKWIIYNWPNVCEIKSFRCWVILSGNLDWLVKNRAGNNTGLTVELPNMSQTGTNPMADI